MINQLYSALVFSFFFFFRFLRVDCGSRFFLLDSSFYGRMKIKKLLLFV